jgi:hypothetical protein
MCVCENSATGIVSTFAIFRVLWTAQNSVLQFLARFFPVPETMLTDVAALTLVEETGNITAGSVGLGIVKNVEPGENGERVADIMDRNYVLGRIKPHPIDETGSEADADEASKRCAVCKSKFKLGFKARHICTKCLSPFCASCGLVTHSSVFACPVRGGCMCGKCLPTYQSVTKRGLRSGISASAVSRASSSSSLDDEPDQMARSKSSRFSFKKWKSRVKET